MCGIAGIWNFDRRPVGRAAIDAFTDSLAHRGPDGRGVWTGDADGIALGHRRLSILDLSDDGSQPMSSADGRYTITYNGEIYNFLELRAELERKGHVFRSASDTEVILAAYREWGPEMLPRFNGMWAFAIYDNRERSLFIARDRFGIKPFLYHLGEKRFAFASELKAFRRLDGFASALDRESAAVFLRNGFGVEGTERTMLQEVRRLPAGHYGVLRDGRLTMVRWWNTLDHLVEPPSSLAAQAERFRELLYDSIRLRMRSDVAIGTCLSGGFDSTAVVCALADIGRTRRDLRQATDWQRAFIATFPGASNDERAEAEVAANYSGVRASFLPVTDADALAGIDSVLTDFDDVYIGLPTAVWLLYRELRRAKVVVSLDGHGADELMGGYVPMAEGSGLFHGAGTALRTALFYHPAFELLRRAARAVRRDPESAFLMPHVPSPGEAFTPLGMNDRLPERWGAANHMLYQMFHSRVLPTILRNFDRMSMAHGVEVRMPFMDWRLVAYLFSLPDASKIGGGYTKRVARLGMAGKMPDGIRLSRRKVGFNSPLPEWFNGPLRPWVREILDGTGEHDLINMPLLRSYVSEQTAGRSWAWRNAVTVWRRLHLLWFERKFIGN